MVSLYSTRINPLDFMFLVINVLSLLMSVHDDNGHDEETNVSQEDQYHWSNDGPDKRCVMVQVATAKRNSVVYDCIVILESCNIM